MKTNAHCPISSGELIHGWIQDSVKLVSCPLNCYTTITVTTGMPLADEQQYLRKALEETLSYFGVKAHFSQQLSLSRQSNAPDISPWSNRIAEIAATVLATARWLNTEISMEEIAEISSYVELIYSTIFPSLTLVDPIEGKPYLNIGQAPNIDILLLLPHSELNTQYPWKQASDELLIQDEQEINEAVRRLKQGCLTQNPKLIGDASTTNAICHHRYEKRPALSKILTLIEQNNCYGITISHENSAVGILYDQQQTDTQQLLAALKQQNILTYYPQHYITQMTSGGLK